MGRRRNRSIPTPARVAPPAGAKGLVVSEVGDGWDAIERVEPNRKQANIVWVRERTCLWWFE